ncbi:MAG: type II secretion system GspH family protein [Candidatus Thermoplasmatota archaeon]|nr:type II secretion system GspH family protein [Candidatus Thermoplasmatota archaeon]
MTAQRGFTLIELAIVLVIVTILIGGLAVPLSAQIQARRIAETNKTLEEAREAIIGYTMSHTTTTCTCAYTSGALDSPPATTCPTNLCPPLVTGTATLTISPRHYLPCPDLNGADPEPDQDNDGVDGLRDINNGVEDRYKTGSNVGRCAASAGHLPWVTLGTAAQDAWGNRLHYSLTDIPAATMYGNSSTGFSNSSTGNNHVCITGAGGCGTGTVASNVPAVLVSYGPNSRGARNINIAEGSPTPAPPLETSPDELENTDADTGFVSRAPTKADSASGEFDDLVVWISDGLLKSRVCPSGGCP